MREQRQGLEWSLSCQRSLRLMWGCTNDSVLSAFRFAVVVDVITEFSRE